MFYLTKHQQYALGTVILMLLTGWAVKAYRTGQHPPSVPSPPPMQHPLQQPSPAPF